MTVKMQWENINQTHSGIFERTRTPTGWLVRETQETMLDVHGTGKAEQGYAWTSSVTFVPDPDHLWLAEVPTT